MRHVGAVGTGDNNGTAVCRLLNVPTHHCAEVLFKVERNVKMARWEVELHIVLSIEAALSCYKKLSCRRETVRCFVSLNISLSRSRSLEVIRS